MSFAIPAAALANTRSSERYGELPLHFEANQGQAPEDVEFLSRGSGYGLYLTTREAILVFAQQRAGAQGDAKSVALRMSLVGAAGRRPLTGVERQPGTANYFIGPDPARWRTDVPTYAKVRYDDVYPGIDLVYYGNQRNLEYDFIVAAGADPSDIVLAFNGADEIEIDAQGDLVLHLGGGSVRQKKPVVYQELDGVRHEIAAAYFRRGADRVGFELAAYDTTRPLVIDPVLSYSTYLGGSGLDHFPAAALDAEGNLYLAGSTQSVDFPTTPGSFQAAGGASLDIFVTKLNASGSALVYSTYLGGSDFDFGVGIAVAADGQAYVGGVTLSPDFPTTPGAIQRLFGGVRDVFVTRLDATGSALVYSTYLGGTALDSGGAIAIDAEGNVYTTGYTRSTDFPTTVGALKPSHGGELCGPTVACDDGFVTKVNATGTALVYSTYLGGSSMDFAFALAVDAAGNSYVTGQTYASREFPTSAGAFQSVSGGRSDGFVSKLDATGSSLVYSTYLGGTGWDAGNAIAVDGDGNAHVTGFAGYFGEGTFPTTPGAFQPEFGGGTPCPPCYGGDAFVTKLNSDGTGLVYSTFLGGSDADSGNNIVVDAAGNAFVTGSTRSSNFPTTADAVQSTVGGLWDVFVTELDPAGSALVFSTYLGGGDDDQASGIVLDDSGNAYVVGQTSSASFPTTAAAFQPTFGGTTDAFAARLHFASRFEEDAAAYSGQWTTYGPDTGTFSGGTVRGSNVIGSSATLAFTGTAVSWLGVRCNVCGIALVSIDGGLPTVVNTSGPGAPGNLKSEVVFRAAGLAPHVNHTITITVSGATTVIPNLPTGGTFVAVDAFDVGE